jgi:hypothetical protein
MEQFYDKKQLPLKILINSFYGMLGAPDVSPFCHIQSAWHITCASRQNMRHMIKYFGKDGFKIVYFHTDGANFVIPKGIENYSRYFSGRPAGSAPGVLLDFFPQFLDGSGNDSLSFIGFVDFSVVNLLFASHGIGFSGASLTICEDGACIGLGIVTREKGVLFHTDAAQGFGKIPLDVEAMNIDLMTISAHKI